jgi:hypothetical protein
MPHPKKTRKNASFLTVKFPSCFISLLLQRLLSSAFPSLDRPRRVPVIVSAHVPSVWSSMLLILFFWSLTFLAQFIRSVFLTYSKLYRFVRIKQKASEKSVVHRLLLSSGSLVCNLIHVTLLTQRLWIWLLYFFLIMGF